MKLSWCLIPVISSNRQRSARYFFCHILPAWRVSRLRVHGRVADGLDPILVTDKFRDECLNEHWFTSVAQARDVIADRRRDYNEVRPHSSCSRIPPAQFAAIHRAQQDCMS